MPEKWRLFGKKMERSGKKIFVRELEDGGGKTAETETIKEITHDGGVVLIVHLGRYIVGVVKHKKGDWRETEDGVEVRVGSFAEYLLVNLSPIPLDVPDGASGTG